MNKKEKLKQEEQLRKKREEEQRKVRQEWFKIFLVISICIYLVLLATSLLSFNYNLIKIPGSANGPGDLFLCNGGWIILLSVLLFISLTETLYFKFRFTEVDKDYFWRENKSWTTHKFEAIGWSLILTIILVVLPPILIAGWKTFMWSLLGVLGIFGIIYWFKLNKRLSRD